MESFSAKIKELKQRRRAKKMYFHEMHWKKKRKEGSSFIAGNGASHQVLFASLIWAHFRYCFTETNFKLVLNCAVILETRTQNK